MVKAEVRKCRRGKKLCANPKCQVQIPIHTLVCKFCGYINSTKKRPASNDAVEVDALIASAKNRVNFRQLSKIKAYFSRIFNEVLSFYLLTKLDRVLLTRAEAANEIGFALYSPRNASLRRNLTMPTCKVTKSVSERYRSPS